MSAYQNKKPLVNVCIPTYNAEKTVVSTLQSILNQTYQNLEIIVVDNASTDNTLALLQKFDDTRIQIYKNSKNIGAEKNWGRCIELASGEYIAIFHADDLYKRDMIKKQVQAFQDNPAIGAVFTTYNHINDRGEIIGESILLPAELRGKEIYYFPEIFIPILRNRNFLMCPSAMVRSEVYKELAPFNDELFGTSADLDMWLRILERHPIAILDEKLMSWRVSKAQGSYRFRYLRTEQADFFKVMDFYLSVKSGDLNIPNSALNKYELQRSMDNIMRAVNHLIKGKSEDARKLLKESFSGKVFRVALNHIEKPKFLAFWVFGVMLLVLVYFRLGRYLGKGLHWLLYTWKRRFV
ncbi:MAG: glycosyltransferase [Methanophagales archaeon]|nr:glycosyltransferase [Methanophagales archaeon]